VTKLRSSTLELRVVFYKPKTSLHWTGFWRVMMIGGVVLFLLLCACFLFDSKVVVVV
jgi:hypothetical protein